MGKILKTRTPTTKCEEGLQCVSVSEAIRLRSRLASARVGAAYSGLSCCRALVCLSWSKTTTNNSSPTTTTTPHFGCLYYSPSPASKQQHIERERAVAKIFFCLFYSAKFPFLAQTFFVFDFLLLQNKPNILLHHGHYRIFFLATTTTQQ